MGGSQSTDPQTVTLENPNKIEVKQNVLCHSEGPKNLVRGDKKVMKREYSAEETDLLTAKLDEDYAAWLKEVESANEDITKRVRDELVDKANDLYERFSYIEGKPICERAQKDVLNCYENNRTTSLNCSEEVKYFTDCVRDHQLNFNRKDYSPKEVPKRKTLL